MTHDPDRPQSAAERARARYRGRTLDGETQTETETDHDVESGVEQIQPVDDEAAELADTAITVADRMTKLRRFTVDSDLLKSDRYDAPNPHDLRSMAADDEYQQTLVGEAREKAIAETEHTSDMTTTTATTYETHPTSPIAQNSRGKRKIKSGVWRMLGAVVYPSLATWMFAAASSWMFAAASSWITQPSHRLFMWGTVGFVTFYLIVTGLVKFVKGFFLIAAAPKTTTNTTRETSDVEIATRLSDREPVAVAVAYLRDAYARHDLGITMPVYEAAVAQVLDHYDTQDDTDIMAAELATDD